MKEINYTIKSVRGLMPFQIPVHVIKKGSHAELSQEYYEGAKVSPHLVMADVSIEPARPGLCHV